ncbi:MAG TPA: PASTA domain-containing protein [Gaiellaceae bacterium]|nr:PASTA domain-containing protein [Gaiellaceae bacterium]
MRRAAILGLAGVSLLLFAGGSAATSAPAKTHWRGTKAALPANAATGANEEVSINSVSCASAGNCAAVGTYEDKSGFEQGLLLTEKTAKWRSGVETAVPANAAPIPGVQLNSVSCASAGNCVAVGSYQVAAGGEAGLLLTEKAGRWATGVEAALPANSASHPLVVLDSVSCASAGNCSAVGSYEDNSGPEEGLLLTEKAGMWGTGVEAALPENTDGARLNSVSCASAGNCSAVGTSGENGLLLTERSGKWQTGVEAVLPQNAIPGQPVSLTSISCASAGNCSAVGTYNDDDGSKDLTTPRGLLLTEKAGTWRAGVEAVPPANSATGGDYQVDVDSVSCGSAGNCVAVGTYNHGPGNIQGLLLTETGGKWRRGLEAALPRNANHPELQEEDVYLSSVSCASPGNCTAAGGYTDNSREDRGLLVTETAGRWARGLEAALPSRADSPAGLAPVSCASPGRCAAAGRYGPYITQGLLLDSTPNPCVVPRLKGKTLPAAKLSIESHDCSVGRIRHVASQRVTRDHVISQHPKPGRQLPLGAKVSLVVSTGR